MEKILISFLLILSYCTFAQEIKCDKADISEAGNLAINTVNINIRRGILAAGGDYGGEWVRDISINSWNGVSLLKPEVAEKSMWSVTVNKDSVGHQYWDRIIWVIAALNHYRATGNTEFLKQAFRCSANTISKLEQMAYDTKYSLFTGPSVFNDGIAGYPEPIYDKTVNSSYVLDHKNSHTIKCLSTNCIYYGAYKALSEMGKLLNADDNLITGYKAKAENLKKNILKYFYSEKENKLNYLIDNTGHIDNSQEGLGISFAVIFGIITKEQANKITSNAAVSKFGITSIYPDFPRYSAEKPGRHNNIIWPMVNGFFAQASVIAGDMNSFSNELDGLTSLALDKDKGNYQFWEIYNPYTGKPDGGWQVGTHWNSCRLQTWSATAYINMVLYGLAGIRLENEGIAFEPWFPGDINYLEIRDIKYHKSNLNIVIKGNGSKIKSLKLNGSAIDGNRISSALKNFNEVVIELD